MGVAAAVQRLAEAEQIQWAVFQPQLAEEYARGSPLAIVHGCWSDWAMMKTEQIREVGTNPPVATSNTAQSAGADSLARLAVRVAVTDTPVAPDTLDGRRAEAELVHARSSESA